MTAEDFWEVGASGRVCSREHVLNVLEQRFKDGPPAEDPWQTSDFQCRQVGESVSDPDQFGVIIGTITSIQPVPIPAAGWLLLGAERVQRFCKGMANGTS